MINSLLIETTFSLLHLLPHLEKCPVPGWRADRGAFETCSLMSEYYIHIIISLISLSPDT